MKVLQVCHRYYPHIGGIETLLHSVSKRLQKVGFEVEVYSADAPPGAAKQEVVDEVSVTRFPSFSLGDTVYLSYPLYRALKMAEADVIHAHNYRALPMLLAALAKKEDTALVVNTHLGFSKLGRWIYHIYNPLFGKRIFDRADRIIISTPAELDEVPILKRYEQKTVCMPNGVDLSEIDRYYLTKRQAKTTLDLLYVGRIERKKGIRAIIETVNYLKGLPVSLNIVGDGPYMQTLRGIVDKLGLTDTITFRGRVTTEELYTIYSTSDVFLLLSEYEAHSIALTEAMAFGLVPVVTRVGGNPCMVDAEFGYIVDYPADADEVATILRQLASNTKLLQQKRDKARNYAVKHFDIETQVKRIIEIYRSVAR